MLSNNRNNYTEDIQMKKIISLGMVLAMLLALTVCAFAVDGGSPENPGTTNKITVTANGSGTATAKDNADGTTTLTATPDKDHSFKSWNITGSYDLVSGKLTDKEIVIKANGDLSVVAVFENASQTVKPWDKPNAPDTGVAVIPVAVAAVVSMLGCAYSVKRSFDA